jgi:hypothetical protein
MFPSSLEVHHPHALHGWTGERISKLPLLELLKLLRVEVAVAAAVVRHLVGLA